MRRKERAMSLKEAEKLLREAPVGRLGTSWKNEAYVIPLNFVYYGGRIFFHCAVEGKKLEYIKKNPRVCFEVDEFISVREGMTNCNFTTHYRSVLAFGEAGFVKGMGEKSEALKKLLEKYVKKRADIVFDEERLRKVKVVEILIKEITGKQNLP
jgi:nitroimidazol reductase NimA-like FMN-containing flavoprotein (pyridoxamine 5'-phosphate oxidase superfamily)